MRYAFLKFVFTPLCQHTLQLDSASLFGACVSPSLFFDGRAAECAAATRPPPSAIIPITRATHSLHLTLFYSYKIMGPPALSSLLLTHSKLMVLPLQVPCPARRYHAVHSSQVPVCPIRNDTGDVMPLAQAITQLSFLEFLQHCGVPLAPPQPSQWYQFLSHSWMLLCRQTHLVTSFRMCPRRRLINRTRFRVMWQCRRLPTVSISYPWMLPRRRPHPVLCLSMSLRRWALA